MKFIEIPSMKATFGILLVVGIAALVWSKFVPASIKAKVA